MNNCGRGKVIITNNSYSAERTTAIGQSHNYNWRDQKFNPTLLREGWLKISTSLASWPKLFIIHCSIFIIHSFCSSKKKKAPSQSRTSALGWSDKLLHGSTHIPLLLWHSNSFNAALRHTLFRCTLRSGRLCFWKLSYSQQMYDSLKILFETALSVNDLLGC